MGYCFSKRVDMTFAEAVAKVTGELKKEGFGVLTEIDVRATLKKKLDVDFRDYVIKAEEKIGLMLPCNVIVQVTPDGSTEVAAIDPAASMAAVENPALEPLGLKVREKMKKIIDAV